MTPLGIILQIVRAILMMSFFVLGLQLGFKIEKWLKFKHHPIEAYPSFILSFGLFTLAFVVFH